MQGVRELCNLPSCLAADRPTDKRHPTTPGRQHCSSVAGGHAGTERCAAPSRSAGLNRSNLLRTAANCEVELP